MNAIALVLQEGYDKMKTLEKVSSQLKNELETEKQGTLFYMQSAFKQLR